MSGHVSDRWHLKRTPKRGEPVCEHRKVPTSKHGKGRRWQVEYADPDGRMHYPCFDRQEDAAGFLVKVRADMLRGTYRDPGGGQTTLRKYALDVFMPAQGFDAVTRERADSALRVHILPSLGDRRLQELAAHPSLVQAAVSGWKLAPSTAGRMLVLVNTIMRWAVRDKLIGDNPCADVKLPRSTKRRVEPWTPEIAAKVRDKLPERYRALIDAGTGLGLRQSELFAMSVENTAFLLRLVHVRAQVKLIGGRLYFAPPKGAKERTVPLAAQTATALAAHMAAFPPAAVVLPWHEPGTRQHGKPQTLNLVFSSPAGRALHRNSFNANVWRVARKAAGVSDDRVNGCHMLRHVYASTLVSRGIDPTTVAAYLGHSDGGALVLRTYSHLMPDAEDRARRALEEALSNPLPVAPATGSI